MRKRIWLISGIIVLLSLSILVARTILNLRRANMDTFESVLELELDNSITSAEDTFNNYVAHENDTFKIVFDEFYITSGSMNIDYGFLVDKYAKEYEYDAIVFTTDDDQTFRYVSDNVAMLDTEFEMLDKTQFFKSNNKTYLAIYSENKGFKVTTYKILSYFYTRVDMFSKDVFEGQAIISILNDDETVIYTSKRDVDISFYQDLKLKSIGEKIIDVDDENFDYYFYGSALDGFDGYFITIMVPKNHYDNLAMAYDHSAEYVFLIHEAILIVVFFIGVFVLYVTYNKNQRKKIEENQEYMQGMFENFNECFLIYSSPKREVLFISNNVSEIIGLSKEELRSLKDIYTVDGKDVILELTNLIITKSGPTVSQLYKFYNKLAKKECIINVCIKDVLFNDEKCYGIILSDITQDYEQKVLLIRKLDQEKENSDQLKSFLSKISHELRTPLNGVIGMNKIAMEKLADNDLESAKDALITVDNNGNYLLSLINNVLDLSKLEQSKVNLSIDSINLNELISSIQPVVQTQLNSRNITFDTEFNLEPETYIMADKLKLTQILMNIISNAIKYNVDGGMIQFKVNCEKLPGNKLGTTFVIKDNGIGMSREFLSKLFTPYASENRGNMFASTGLGLVISKSFVQLMGGTIEVESHINVGSTFTINFAFDLAQKTIPTKLEESDFDFSKLKVLLAEDNEINTIVCMNHLKKKGIVPDTVVNGQAAVEKFSSSPVNTYDLILMDIQMPLMNGYEATREIRMLEREDNNVAIIAMTADAFESDIKKALINKMDGHISKPIIPKQMFKTIQEVMIKKQNKK